LVDGFKVSQGIYVCTRPSRRASRVNPNRAALPSSGSAPSSGPSLQRDT